MLNIFVNLISSSFLIAIYLKKDINVDVKKDVKSETTS